MEQWIIDYGYVGIFIILVIGIVGIPLPDEMLMTFVGYQVYQGKMSYLIAWLSAFSGAVVGITISYYLGLKLGLPFLQKFGPKMHITEKKIERTQKLFNQYGNFIITIGYFIPGVRHLTAYLAGISKMKIPRFMFFAYSGALFWSFTFITLGRELGKKWFIVQEQFHRFGFTIIIFFVLIVILFLLYVKFRRNPLQGKKIYKLLKSRR